MAKIKAKVLSNFVDKNTGDKYKRGTLIEVESEKRLNEINEAGFGVLLSQVKDKSSEKDDSKTEDKAEDTGKVETGKPTAEKDSKKTGKKAVK